MNNLIIKRLFLLLSLVALFHSMAFGQSKPVFLSLKLGETTYQDALTQIQNSKYGDYIKIHDGSIFIVGTSVKQNGGKVWDHADIHFLKGYVNNIQFSSASNSGHSTDYITKMYQETKSFYIPKNGYEFWLKKEGNINYYKYYGCAVVLEMFDSEAAGKVVRVQHIAL